MRIVFMGTPEFAVPSLDALVQAGYEIVGVITAPDKPAGRGHKIQESAIKKYALSKGLNVLQPEKLKAESFIKEYQNLNPDLNVVVAFRMLPKIIWDYPTYGTFNLHASLLPQYRGAAPINWAIINGEEETGVTTFFIDEEIDTGKVILQEKVPISLEMTAGDLHDILMVKGANLVAKTAKTIENREFSLIDQSQLTDNQDIILKPAPKIFKPQQYLDITKELAYLDNQIRGLSPYPGAIIPLVDQKGNELSVKVYRSHFKYVTDLETPGTLVTDGKTYLAIAHKEGKLFLDEIQFPGKKKLPIADYLRGSQLSTGQYLAK